MDSTPRAPRTCIAMATFNGEQYLPAQIDSIRAQTFRDWTLLVRDDGSTDATLERVRKAAADDPRVEIVADDDGRLGPVRSFARLAAVALDRGADRLFFADQDDVWFSGRMERMLEAMRDAERQAGWAQPVLVHTDLQLIDGNDRVIHPSFMQFQRIHHEASAPLGTLLVQNFVTGCAMVVNRPLLALAVPVPADVLMHDWWFALCAASAGKLAFLPAPSASYRRHGSNAVSVRGFWRTMNPVETNWVELWRTGTQHHARAVRQAAALLDRLRERATGSDDARRTAAAFVDLHRAGSPLSRVAAAMRLGLRSQTPPRTLALYLRLLRPVA